MITKYLMSEEEKQKALYSAIVRAKKSGIYYRNMERELGLADGTISKFILGKRGFPHRHYDKMYCYLSDRGFTY